MTLILLLYATQRHAERDSTTAKPRQNLRTITVKRSILAPRLHAVSTCVMCKGPFIATQLNSTQLNSTDPVEQRTASQSCFCL